MTSRDIGFYDSHYSPSGLAQPILEFRQLEIKMVESICLCEYNPRSKVTLAETAIIQPHLENPECHKNITQRIQENPDKTIYIALLTNDKDIAERASYRIGTYSNVTYLTCFKNMDKNFRQFIPTIAELLDRYSSKKDP